MRVSVHAPDLGRDLVRTINERIEAVLGRYAEAIDRIVVRVRDENGPRGGEDQSCLLRIGLRGAPEVVVRQRGDQPMAALAGALKRARRSGGERVNARGRRHTTRQAPKLAAAETAATD